MLISQLKLRFQKELDGFRGDSPAVDRRLLALASTLSFLLAFLFSPLWSRVYPVEYFTVWALIQVVPGLLASWSTLAFHNAVIAPENDSESLVLILVSGISVTLVTLIVCGLVVLVPGWLADDLIGNGVVKPWLWVSPMLLIVQVGSLIMDQWMIRVRRLRSMAAAIAAQAVLGPVVPLIGLLAPMNTNFIIWGGLLGNVGGFLLRLRLSGVWDAFRHHKPRWEDAWRTVVRFRQYPRDVSASNVLTSISGQMPLLMIARYFSQDAVGHYARVGALLNIPSTILARSFTASFMQQAGVAYRERGDCRPEMKKLLRDLLTMVGPVYLLIGLTAPWIYPWFYGHDWAETGRMAQPMSLCLFAAMIASPLGEILNFSRNTLRDVVWQVLRLALVAGALWYGCSTGQVLVALAALAGANVVAYCIYGMIAWRCATKPVIYDAQN